MQSITLGIPARCGTELGYRNPEQVAGARASRQIDLTPIAIVGNHYKNSVVALDNYSIPELGEIVQRGDFRIHQT